MVLPQLVGWAQKEKVQPKWLPCMGKRGEGGVLVGRARKLSWVGQRNKNPEEGQWRRSGTLVGRRVGDTVSSLRLQTGSFSGSERKTAE